jgi:hypothetical protein
MSPSQIADMLAGFVTAWIIWALFAPMLVPWI